MKYVLMGTSSNFGNMFSAAAGSFFLSFLPMLPTQILLNNLLYDVSEMTIPTDNVDEELLRRPSHWDTGQIRRFTLFFGPISSVFNFVTFAVLLLGLHAGPTLFRAGWFVESLATQSLAIFAIRTRRVPFFRSRPSIPLHCSTRGRGRRGVAALLAAGRRTRLHAATGTVPRGDSGPHPGLPGAAGGRQAAVLPSRGRPPGTPGPAGGRYGAPLPTPPDPSPGVPLEHRPPTADLSRLTQVGEMSPASSSSHRNRATTGASSSALVIRPR